MRGRETAVLIVLIVLVFLGPFIWQAVDWWVNLR